MGIYKVTEYNSGVWVRTGFVNASSMVVAKRLLGFIDSSVSAHPWTKCAGDDRHTCPLWDEIEEVTGIPPQDEVGVWYYPDGDMEMMELDTCLEDFKEFYKALTTDSHSSWAETQGKVCALCDAYNVTIVASGTDGYDTSWDRRGRDIWHIPEKIQLTRGSASALALWAVRTALFLHPTLL